MEENKEKLDGIPDPQTPKAGMTIKIEPPDFMSVNGRIICQAIPKKIEKTDSGIILPDNALTFNESSAQKERVTNKWGDKLLYVVALPANIQKEMPLPPIKDNNGRTLLHPKIELGDRIIMSPMMEPIEYRDGVKHYVAIHFLDVLGVVKTEKRNTQ